MSYQDTVLATAGLAAYWRLNEETSTGSIIDSAGSYVSNQVGMLSADANQPGPTDPFTIGDTSFVFDGVDAYISVDDDAELLPLVTGGASVEFFIKTANGTTINRIFDIHKQGSPVAAFHASINSDAVPPASEGASSNKLTGHCQMSVSLGVCGYGSFTWDDLWHHVVMVVDLSVNPGVWRMYVDGVSLSITYAAGMQDDMTASSFPTTGQAVTIGAGYGNAGGATNFFTGYLSNVSFYSTALSADTVAEHYAKAIFVLQALRNRWSPGIIRRPHKLVGR